jgi:hypothetical protein
MMAAIQLIKANDVAGRFEVQTMSPAAIQVEMTRTISNHPLISTLKPAINFHYITNHWMTSYYDPMTEQVCVYDSLCNPQHRVSIHPQLVLLYGRHLANNVQFPNVTQQLMDPTCGAFSVAFALSLYLGVLPNPKILFHIQLERIFNIA